MDAHRKDDSVIRELRCFELARRLIFYEVRTQTISKFTGLSRNRLETLRRRQRMLAVAAPRRARSMCSCVLLMAGLRPQPLPRSSHYSRARLRSNPPQHSMMANKHAKSTMRTLRIILNQTSDSKN
jgi:hypothetical protein